MYMSYFDQAAMIKVSETGWLISHSPGGWKYKYKVPADSVTGEDPLPGYK